jgi:hypothetical protein
MAITSIWPTVDVQLAAHYDFFALLSSSPPHFVYQHLFSMSSFSSCFTTRHFLVAVSSPKERTRKVLVALLLISHFSRLASLVTPTASTSPVDQPRRSDLSVSSFSDFDLSSARLRNARHPPPRSHPFSRFSLSRFFFFSNCATTSSYRFFSSGNILVSNNGRNITKKTPTPKFVHQLFLVGVDD